MGTWDKIGKKRKNIVFDLIVRILTSQPLEGGSPSHPGGGPPNFLCPVVTSSVYPVLSNISLIFSSSGPLTACPPTFDPAAFPLIFDDDFMSKLMPDLDFCLYVFMTPQRYADLFETCSKLDSRNWARTARAPSAGNSLSASKARSSRSE